MVIVSKDMGKQEVITTRADAGDTRVVRLEEGEGLETMVAAVMEAEKENGYIFLTSVATFHQGVCLVFRKASKLIF